LLAASAFIRGQLSESPGAERRAPSGYYPDAAHALARSATTIHPSILPGNAMHRIRRTGTALLASALVAACSSNDASTVDSTAMAPVSSAVGRPHACTLVAAAEMSTILGATVVAVPDDSSGGKAGCTYQPPAGPVPTVKLAVDWGGGEAAMTTMVALGQKILPGVGNPYEGIGDEVAMVGSMLLIRAGEHLMSLEIAGVEDPPRKARQIFDAVKPRL
jgi:hypothetical protein